MEFALLWEFGDRERIFKVNIFKTLFFYISISSAHKNVTYLPVFNSYFLIKRAAKSGDRIWISTK